MHTHTKSWENANTPKPIESRFLTKDFELNDIFHPICHNWIVLFSFSAYNNQLDALE